MPRIKLELPAELIFSTEIPVRITDINYGGHLGNDSIISIVQEARVRFLKKYNYTEKNVEGLGIIMTDCAIVYKSESFYGDILEIFLQSFLELEYQNLSMSFHHFSFD